MRNSKFISMVLYVAILAASAFWVNGQCTGMENYHAPEQPYIVYRNPRVFNITYFFEIAPDQEKADREKDLKLWLPVPREWDAQKAVKILSVNPSAHDTYEDPEYGNHIFFWDFGKEPEQVSYKARIKCRLEVYEVHAEVDPARVGHYDKASKEYVTYTQSGRTECITPKVMDLAKEAVAGEKNPYLQAKRIVEFVEQRVRYKVLFDVRGRGIQCLLDYPVKDEKTGMEYYEGECTQRSSLIVTCCRAMGIPARAVTGCVGWSPGINVEDSQWYSEDKASMPLGLGWFPDYRGHFGLHTWTEVYIPNYGWIPVDKQIGHLDNKRVIFSKGRDIKLGPHCPQNDSEGYWVPGVLIHDGSADLLSPAWGVYNVAKISKAITHSAKSRILMTLDPFPADALADYNEDWRKSWDWRKSTLEWISFMARGYLDEEAERADAGLSQGHRQDIFVCHMLRKIVGDDIFFRVCREYENLRLTSGQPVSTTYFQKMMEDAHGKTLGWFFDQWRGAKGLPQLKLGKVSMNKDGEGWKVHGCLLQTGSVLFRVPVEFALETEKGTERHIIWQEDKEINFEFQTLSRPLRLRVDPDNSVLRIQRMPPRLRWFWRSYPDQPYPIQPSSDILPVYVSVYGTISEAEANKAAAERFNTEYLGKLTPKYKVIKADMDVVEEDLKANVVFLFGRPETNKVAQQFKDIFPIRFDEGKFSWQGTTYDQPTQGVVQVIDNPFARRCLVILYAGLSSEATLQICNSYLYGPDTSYVIFDGYKHLISGDWEEDSDLVWDFRLDVE